MRILIVHRYYWPDVPAYAHMLHIMAKHFSAAGHEVTVFSTQPSYNNIYQGDNLPKYEVRDGVAIHRMRLLKENKRNPFARAINVAIFCSRLLWHGLTRSRYDLITVATFPPVVMGWMARILGAMRGSKYLYHCQDLYPEVALASGVLRRPWLARLAKSIDCRNCQKSAAVVVLSGDMKQTIGRRAIQAEKLQINNVHIINNFVIDKLDLNAVPELEKELQKAPGRYRVLFAGNLGRFQALEQLLEAAHRLKDHPQIEFCFVGQGALRDKLIAQAGKLLGKSVFFHPHQPLSKVMGMIHEADLSVISLSPGVIDCAYPSKTMTYLEAGCRMLAILEPHSELAQFIKQENLGVVCETPDAERISQLVLQEFARSQLQSVDRDALRKVARTVFGQPVILAKWTALLAELESALVDPLSSSTPVPPNQQPSPPITNAR